MNAHGRRQIVAGRLVPAFFVRTCSIAALTNCRVGGVQYLCTRMAGDRPGDLPRPFLRICSIAALTNCGRAVAAILHSHGGRRIVAGRLALAFFARIRKMVHFPAPTARTALSPPLPGALPVWRLRQGIASALSCDFAREDSRRIQVGMAYCSHGENTWGGKRNWNG